MVAFAFSITKSVEPSNSLEFHTQGYPLFLSAGACLELCSGNLRHPYDLHCRSAANYTIINSCLFFFLGHSHHTVYRYASSAELCGRLIPVLCYHWNVIMIEFDIYTIPKMMYRKCR
jgi:hypothetical protein